MPLDLDRDDAPQDPFAFVCFTWRHLAGLLIGGLARVSVGLFALAGVVQVLAR